MRQLDDEAGDSEPEPAAEQAGGAVDYETVLDSKALERWLKKIDKAGIVAFDTETNSLDYMTAELVGLSLAVAEGDACYVPAGA